MTGAELRQLREGRGLTRKALAEELGIHWRTLLKYERGERRIRPIVVKLLNKIIESQIGT